MDGSSLFLVAEEQFSIKPLELITDQANGYFGTDLFKWDLKRDIKIKEWKKVTSTTTSTWEVGNEFPSPDHVATADIWVGDDVGNDDEDLDPWVVPNQTPVNAGMIGHLYAEDTPEMPLQLPGYSAVTTKFNFKSCATLNGIKCSEDYFWNASALATRRPEDGNWNLSEQTINGNDTIGGTIPPDIEPERIFLKVGVPSTQSITLLGVTGTYQIFGQNMPDGIRCDRYSNQLVGTPSQVGITRGDFTAKYNDGTGDAYIQKKITIEVQP